MASLEHAQSDVTSSISGIAENYQEMARLDPASLDLNDDKDLPWSDAVEMARDAVLDAIGSDGPGPAVDYWLQESAAGLDVKTLRQMVSKAVRAVRNETD